MGIEVVGHLTMRLEKQQGARETLPSQVPGHYSGILKEYWYHYIKGMIKMSVTS